MEYFNDFGEDYKRDKLLTMAGYIQENKGGCVRKEIKRIIEWGEHWQM